MTSGQEMERADSYNPEPAWGALDIDAVFHSMTVLQRKVGAS